VKIGEVLNAVYDVDVGWRPASGGIKPVHVANGVVRAHTRRVYKTKRIVDVIIPYKKKKDPVPDPNKTLESLLQRDPTDALEAFREQPLVFESFRRYLRGLLEADKAVFPSADMSSLTLTCRELASRDNNDRRLGEFGAALLRLSDGDGATTLGQVFSDSLIWNADQADPLSVLARPLVELEGRAPPESHRDSMVKALGKKHQKQFCQEVMKAMADLATHEVRQGNRLRTLKRSIQLVCLATHAHAQALAAGGDLARRSPALVCLAEPPESPLARASNDSLNRIHSAFERWLGERLADRLRYHKPLHGEERLDSLSLDSRSVKAQLKKIKNSSGSTPEEGAMDIRLQTFKEAKRQILKGADGGDNPSLVWGRALTMCYLREYESGGPRSFLQGLARRAGLLYPHQRKSQVTRIRPSASVWDVLVRACVSCTEQHITLDEFLERLWFRFGLVVGGRQRGKESDADLLARHGVELEQDILVTNTAELVRMLQGMGLARPYADNVTLIGDVQDAS